MTFAELVLHWPRPGSGTLLILAAMAIASASAGLRRTLPNLRGQRGMVLAHLAAALLLAAGAMIFAGNRLSTGSFAVVATATILLALANLRGLRELSATAMVALSGRVRPGDRVRSEHASGTVEGLHLGWIALRTAEGPRIVPASTPLHREGVNGAVDHHLAAPCALEFTADRAGPSLEETLRHAVLCSPYAALSAPPEIVCTWRGETCAVRVRAWALSASHTAHLASDLTSRCLALGLREPT